MTVVHRTRRAQALVADERCDDVVDRLLGQAGHIRHARAKVGSLTPERRLLGANATVDGRQRKKDEQFLRSRPCAGHDGRFFAFTVAKFTLAG